MAQVFSFETTVTYGDADRHEAILLPRLFKLLQEAAIVHANQFGAGTNVVATRGESWVLNRIEVGIERYPRVGETLRVETWSTGIKSFKGFRDFRIFDGQGCRIVAASSLWLYLSLTTKAIRRVPREIAETFPVGPEPAWRPELETWPDALPGAAATTVVVSLRYSDFDVNEHVNHTAYLDLVQTALAITRQEIHPRRLHVHYAKAIPLTTETVEVRIGISPGPIRFRIGAGGTVFATGAIDG